MTVNLLALCIAIIILVVCPMLFIMGYKFGQQKSGEELQRAVDGYEQMRQLNDRIRARLEGQVKMMEERDRRRLEAIINQASRREMSDSELDDLDREVIELLSEKEDTDANFGAALRELAAVSSPER